MDGYLAHEGILGMKWGVKNGPPYPLKNSQKSAAEKKQSKNKTSNKKNNNDDNKKKSISEMSDQELQSIISRLKLEKEYRSLTAKQKSAFSKAMSEAVVRGVASVAQAAIVKTGNNLIDSMVKDMKKDVDKEKNKN